MALEQHLAAQDAEQARSPEAVIDGFDRAQLLAAAAAAVQGGDIVIDRDGARLGVWLQACAEHQPDRRDATARLHHAHMARVCARLNREVLAQGTIFIPLFWPDQVQACRAGFGSGDWFFGGSACPESMIVRNLRRPTGEVWNTEGGGELSRIGLALASWAAQRGTTLMVDVVLRWIDELYAKGVIDDDQS